jgi:hypothetical protein
VAGLGWPVLDAGGVISRWDLAAGTCTALAAASVPGEPDHQAWCGHELRRRLRVSASGLFAAVVNDYGRFGEVIDLRAGRVKIAIDNGGGDAEPCRSSWPSPATRTGTWSSTGPRGTGSTGLTLPAATC